MVTLVKPNNTVLSNKSASSSRMRFLGPYGKMTTGVITTEIKKEIRRTITAGQHNVFAVFGFGSHFRSEPYNDIDILVVLKPGCGSLLPIYYGLKRDLEDLGERFDVAIDLTVLTSEEFADRPLRDMDSLVEIVAPPDPDK